MKRILLAVMILSLTGCLRKNHLINSPYPTVEPVAIFPTDTPVYEPGSLFTEHNSASGLISDAKAFRVNDIVLVGISESMTATNAANTDLARSSANSFSVENLFGKVPGLGSAADGTVLGTGTESTHAGTGTTKRSDTFTGSVATRVVQVLPNGYLVIQGNKEVQVNSESVKCYMTGIVNPLMISRDHIISSTQVADLKIRYGGYGVVAAQQSPGLFTKILNLIWPF